MSCTDFSTMSSTLSDTPASVYVYSFQHKLVCMYKLQSLQTILSSRNIFAPIHWIVSSCQGIMWSESTVCLSTNQASDFSPWAGCSLLQRSQAICSMPGRVIGGLIEESAVSLQASSLIAAACSAAEYSAASTKKGCGEVCESLRDQGCFGANPAKDNMHATISSDNSHFIVSYYCTMFIEMSPQNGCTDNTSCCDV